MVTRISSLLFAALLSLAGAQSFAATPQTLQLQSSQSYYYSFGSWPVGYTTFQDFTFTNYSGVTRIYSIYTFGTAYNSIDNCPAVLYGGYSCTIRIFFRPWFVGYQDGQTTISTDNGATQVYLSGYGY